MEARVAEAMNIDECKLITLDEYCENGVVKKGTTSGRHFQSIVINILPGQEVPTHSHAGHEVILIPQTGAGILFDDDSSQINLVPGSIYTDHNGSIFGLRNSGDKPFQVLVILVNSTNN